MSQNTQRYHLVDALRGFAILGILLLHSIEHFNFYSYPDESSQAAWLMIWNGKIWDTMFWLFGGKAYGIFALLFGFTFHLQYSRQAEKGKDFGPRFMWRMVLLLGFGIINASLFPGEILVMYAALSPVLFLSRKWNTRALLIASTFFLLQPYELYHFVRSMLSPEYVTPNLQVGNIWNQTMDYIREGSFSGMFSNVFTGIKMTFIWSMSVGRIFQTMGLFLLGVYLGRTQLFDNSLKSAAFWRKALTILVPLAVILFMVEAHSFNEASSSIKRSLGVAVSAWKNGTQLLTMVGLFSLGFRTAFFRKLTQPLYNYGRMSLSNYMMQSLVGGVLFYPYAFHLAEKLNVTYSLLLGFGLAIIFILFCNWWIKNFRQGPMEMLWHKLTWLDRN